MKTEPRYFIGKLGAVAVVILSAAFALIRPPWFNLFYLGAVALGVLALLLPAAWDRFALLIGIAAAALIVTGRGIAWHRGECTGAGFLSVSLTLITLASYLGYRYWLRGSGPNKHEPFA